MSRGYTLVELVIALAILAVLIAVGWGSVRDHLPRYRTVRAAKELRGDLLELQAIAVETNRETRLRFTGSGGDCADRLTWGGSWQAEVGNRSRGSDRWDVLPIEPDDSTTDERQGEGIVNLGPEGTLPLKGVCLEAWPSLSGPGTGNADALVFAPRGWLANPAEDFDSRGLIAVTFVNQQAAKRGVEDEIAVTITRAGLIRLQTSLGSTFPQNAVGTATASVAP